MDIIKNDLISFTNNMIQYKKIFKNNNLSHNYNQNSLKSLDELICEIFSHKNHSCKEISHDINPIQTYSIGSIIS